MQHFSNMSVDDLNLRYSSTFVKANNKPFYIYEVISGKKFKGRFMHNSESATLDLDSIDSFPPRWFYHHPPTRYILK